MEKTKEIYGVSVKLKDITREYGNDKDHFLTLVNNSNLSYDSFLFPCHYKEKYVFLCKTKANAEKLVKFITQNTTIEYPEICRVEDSK